MKRFYLIKANKQIDSNIDFSSYLSNKLGLFDLNYVDEYRCYFESENDLFDEVENFILCLSSDLNISISVLSSHDISDFCFSLLEDAFVYYPKQVVFPSDVVMKQMSFGNFKSLSELKSMFSNCDYEILETVGTYLRCGLDGIRAAKKLNIHRNTFNYRIAKFISTTNLDIRDYHNALLLELYFQLS